MAGNKSDNDEKYHIRKEPIDNNLSDDEVSKLCELRKEAGAIECTKEDGFLVTKWPIL